MWQGQDSKTLLIQFFYIIYREYCQEKSLGFSPRLQKGALIKKNMTIFVSVITYMIKMDLSSLI